MDACYKINHTDTRKIISAFFRHMQHQKFHCCCKAADKNKRQTFSVPLLFLIRNIPGVHFASCHTGVHFLSDFVICSHVKIIFFSAFKG